MGKTKFLGPQAPEPEDSSHGYDELLGVLSPRTQRILFMDVMKFLGS